LGTLVSERDKSTVNIGDVLEGERIESDPVEHKGKLPAVGATKLLAFWCGKACVREPEAE
tara:strand:+ start:1371 stop:1550 length:180 start_codon:yes stop_codon:yes gene_type:complete